MTQEQFCDLQQLGQSITKYCRAMGNFRAVKESREMLAKGMRQKYPNMKVEAIRDALWKQEGELEKTAQVEFDEMRMNAYSLGWNFDHKYTDDEVKGIMRKDLVLLKDINV
jgi:hypothetical protein